MDLFRDTFDASLRQLLPDQRCIYFVTFLSLSFGTHLKNWHVIGMRRRRTLYKYSRLYFCAKFAWFFMLVVPFGNLLFIHALTNVTDDHKYSPFPSQILTVPELWYHLAHSFWRKNVPFDFERAFWEAEGALSKPKGHFSSKMKLKKCHQNTWHWQKSA